MDFNVSGTVGIAGINVIPKMPVVVLGAVAHPRKIFVHDVRDLTVTKAIELAGGFKGAADQCLVVVLQIPNASAKASADKSGTMMRPQRKGRLSDFAKGEAADLHSGDIVMVVDGGLLASALGSNDPHAIVGGISLMNNKMFDDLLKLVGDDPRFPKSDIIKAKAMLNGAFTGNLRKYEQDAGIVRVTGNGKSLFYAIEESNIERKAAGLPSAWPRTTVEKAKEDDPDISELAIKSAADYFAALFDVKNQGTENWMPYLGGGFDNLGKDVVVNNAIVAEKLDWCIAANLADGTPANVPVLVTANFNPALLLRKWDGKTDADKILPIGPASGASKSMFNDVAIVVVYKGGSVKRIDAEKLTYAAIYGKPFDATKGNPPLSYLTPTGVAEPTAGNDR